MPAVPTGFVVDERCFWHDPGNYALMLKPGGFIGPHNRHIENADPKRRFHNLLHVSGLLGRLTAIAPGCGDGAYHEAFDRIVLPTLEACRPQLIIVPCGYDAGCFDPLGRMLLDDISFRWMTQAVMDVATRHANGRMVFTHEGCCCPVSVPFLGLAVVEELSGLTTEVICPFTAQHAKVPGHALADHQRDLVLGLARQFEEVRQRCWA